MTTEEMKGQFSILPNELIIAISEFFSFSEAHKLLQVNTTWYLLLAPQLQKHHEDLLCALDYNMFYTTACSQYYSHWDWTYPDAYQRYDGRNYHIINQTSSANFLITKHVDMTIKEFTAFKHMNGMTIVKGAIPFFECEQPLFIRKLKFNKPEEPYTIDNDRYGREDTRVDSSEWKDLRQLICSINSLKRRVIMKEEGDLEYGNYNLDLYFLMRDGTVWNMNLQCEIREERYTRFNE